MKLAASLAALMVLTATPSLAQTAMPTTVQGAPVAAASASAAARLSVETPIETVVADAAGKKVLDADLPTLTTNEHYDMFKSMSLTQLAGMAPDKLTPERLAKVNADLAAIK
ncbi:MAG: hypothetical protein ABIS14_02105 [Sphingomonas sp.]